MSAGAAGGDPLAAVGPPGYPATMALFPMRSIKVPIVMGVIAVPLTIAVLVGWILVLVRNPGVSEQVATHTWLLVAGILSLAVILTVLVLFSVFLSREIRESQRQERFIDSVTHELKSPLAALKLFVETLDRRDLDPQQRSKVYRMMLEDIDRLGAFIDDVLRASRVGYDGDRAFERVPIAELAERAADRVRQRHGVSVEQLRVTVEPAALEVVSDPTGLETVLRNLLDNAVKYSDKDVSVTLRIERTRRDRVRFEVSDRGIGIPPEHLKRVFERFYRVPEEDVKRRRGTGLGLYVAAAIVHNLGGRLSAASAGSGTGTTMRFELPPRALSPQGASASAPPST